MSRIISRRTAMAGLAGAGFATAATAEPSGGILFVGNSLTYSNNLPALVQAIFDAAGDPREVAEVARPDYSLSDHWQFRRARRAIQRRQWAWVVLQQGPSSRQEGAQSLMLYARRFGELVTEAGALPALYSVWTPRSDRAFFDLAVQSYENAARETGAILCPAAAAWRAAWRISPDLPLYSHDGFHPSVLGSYLAALTIHAALTGDEPHVTATLRSRDGHGFSVPQDLGATLRIAVSEAVAAARGSPTTNPQP